MDLPSSIEKRLNHIVFFGSLLLFVTLSFDIFNHTAQMNRATGYVQFAVCLIFMYDFFVRLSHSKDRRRYWLKNWLYLLVSIPYLFILTISGVALGKGLYSLLHIIPVIRGWYALGLMVSWLGKERSSTLFVTYLGAMLSLIYFASLLFFEYEGGVNSYVSDYWSALWWACMDTTTVGSNIIAQTAVGKVLSVALAAVGMMMFPIFTTYILSLYKKK